MSSGTYIFQKDLMLAMAEALDLCIQEISKHNTPGNSKVKEKLGEYQWTLGYVQEHLPQDGHPSFCTLGDEPVGIIKGAFTFYAAHLKGVRENVKETATVEDGATEELDRKIQIAEDFTRSPGLAKISADTFLKPRAAAAPPHHRQPIITDSELAKTVRGLVDQDDGTNDRAINDACVILETRIRETAQLEKSDFGKRLVDKTFRPKDGLLILGETDAEQEGWWRLYDGFFQTFRNPTGHRRVATSRTRAAQVIGMADYLICQLGDARRRA